MNRSVSNTLNGSGLNHRLGDGRIQHGVCKSLFHSFLLNVCNEGSMPDSGTTSGRIPDSSRQGGKSANNL